MIQSSRRLVRLMFCLSLWGSTLSAGEVELIGVGRLDGTATDRSGQSDALVNGTPHDRFGGISALDFTGEGDCYLAVADRGPDDGATSYQCRFHRLEIPLPPNADHRITPRIVATTLLSDARRQPFLGDATAYAADANSAGRLDPEGLRITQTGSLFVSEEYGPQLIEFSPAGIEVRRFPLPEYLRIKVPAASKSAENDANTHGRASNRGMEGLTLSADGRLLVGVMQSPVLQDSDRDEQGKPIGLHVRLITIDRETEQTCEYVYPLNDASYMLNEILAIGPNEFLVIERDGLPGNEAAFKRIMKIDLTNATPIDGRQPLSSFSLSPQITPVSKETFIDLLDAEFSLQGETMPEKIESLTFGPRLSDGRRTLLIASDNDFQAESPTWIWVFAMN